MLWTVNAVLHSFLNFIFVTTIFWNSPSLNGGYNSYHWVWSTTLFCTILTTVLLKAASISSLWVRNALTKSSLARYELTVTVFPDEIHCCRHPRIPRVFLGLPRSLRHHCTEHTRDSPFNRVRIPHWSIVPARYLLVQLDTCARLLHDSRVSLDKVQTVMLEQRT